MELDGHQICIKHLFVVKIFLSKPPDRFQCTKSRNPPRGRQIGRKSVAFRSTFIGWYEKTHPTNSNDHSSTIYKSPGLTLINYFERHILLDKPRHEENKFSPTGNMALKENIIHLTSGEK